MGSRYCPSIVRWFNTRASQPSSASLNPASTSKPNAQCQLPSRTLVITNGMKISRRSVS